MEQGRHELDVVERSLSPDQRVFRDSIITLFTSWHKCIASTTLINYRRLDEKKMKSLKLSRKNGVYKGFT